MKNFTPQLLLNSIILPLILIGLLFSAQAVYAQGLENDIKVVKPRVPSPTPAPTPMPASTPIPTKSGNGRGDGKKKDGFYVIKNGETPPSFPGLGDDERKDDVSVRLQEILYVNISVRGSIETIDIQDSKQNIFEPYFFLTPKNAEKVGWLMKPSANVKEEEDKKKFVEKITEPLPETNFNANASEAWFWLGRRDDYEINFVSDGWMKIEILQGQGELKSEKEPTDLTFAKRYIDVSEIPKGANVKLKVNFQGNVSLTYDSNNDGRFDGYVKPTATLFGAQAKDTEAPKVDISVKYTGNTAIVTISATDNQTGVKSVRYSTEEEWADGSKQFNFYQKSFVVNYSGRPILVEVFADDKAGNRSDIYTKIIKFAP